LIRESPLVPESWSAKAIFVDEARGEAEEVSSIKFDQQDVNLFWLVPLNGSEYDLIKREGIEEFDRIEAKSDISLLDVNRQGIG